ncbi:carboxypeptidase regulatory-like domain-containing protein [Nocardioides bruguierae]|uniref:carboxypeptidase regulatory-like domain-containing protein n=1 Tax=Nocardioides bruguierae TaxID=2945102 RepID=UPI00202285E7|nr:carboxypeptidase regulatory-like domain-containing protein [Nocardioides bruguierae]MCL8025445.1 carboxypeptidase-like regulatory domain-containing protein [Nocardioides bruguierae]
MRSPLLVSSLALALLAPTAVSAEDLPTGSVSGTVTSMTGAGLGGVVVSVQRHFSDADPTLTTTAADGTWHVDGLGSYDYEVCFEAGAATAGDDADPAGGYLDRCYLDAYRLPNTYWTVEPTVVPVTDGDETVGVDQVLPTGGIATGTVTDDEGTPLAGATVNAVISAGVLGSGVSAADGAWTITRLPEVEAAFCVGAGDAGGGLSQVGYLDRCLGADTALHEGTEVDGDATWLPVGAESPQDLGPLALAAAGRLTGTVTDGHGLPVAGVRVLASPGGATTDAEGRWTIEAVGARYHGTRIDPRKPTTLRFLAPIGSDLLDQYWPDLYLADGRRPPGTSPVQVEVSAGVATTVDLTMQRGRTVSGTITDPDGTPLADAYVNLGWAGSPNTSQVETDADGHFVKDRLPAGDFEVCISASDGPWPAGYYRDCLPQLTGQESVTVDDQDVTLDLVLRRAGGIRGTIYDQDQEAVRGYVEVYDGDERIRRTYTSHGHYVVGGLTTGSYTVCFETFSPALPWQGCWSKDGAGQQIDADPIEVRAGDIVRGVDAVLGGTTLDRDAPVVRLSQPRRLFTTSTTLRPVLRAADASEVTGYGLRLRTADPTDRRLSAFTRPAAWRDLSGRAPALTNLERGRTYCVSGYAADEWGNVSDWSAERCTVVPFDARDLARSKGWRDTRVKGAFQRTVLATSARGRTLRLPGARAAQVAVAVRTGRGHGRIAVMRGSKRIATLRTSARRSGLKLIVVPGSWKPVKQTITLRTLDRKPVEVDALAVTRVR